MKASQSQFKIMLAFMEKHGDLSRSPEGAKGRDETLQKWYELVELLNSAPEGEPKPLIKWRKVWSDLKNNTKRKYSKIVRHEVKQCALSKLERKVLKFAKEAPFTLDDSDTSMYCKEESDHCLEETRSPQRIFCSVDGDHSNRSSMLSENSLDTLLSPKKDIESNIEKQMKEMTDKIIELEKQREKMAHEREMARIHQNDQFLAVFGRIVNVLETLAPSVQRYLDQNINR